jgi:digeranylgeranylglycerophospholipid reductase
VYDVIVIGGNLAGSSAAISASGKRVNVALVERNKEPFNPAHCGEAMAEVTTKIYGLDKIDFTKNRLSNLLLNVESKEYLIKIQRFRIIIFDRNRVENGLLKRAEKQGVELFLGSNTRDYKPPNEIVLDNNKIIKGKVIIDASGISCQVGRRMGMDTKLRKKDIGVCIQSRVKGDFIANTAKAWFHKPYAPLGYAYVFPLNEKLANIGLGVFGGRKLDLRKLLKNYIKDMTRGNYEIISTFRACVPLAPPMSRIVKDNVMITGDAARLANPILGNGIRNALFSGSLAGLIAAKYARREITSLAPYQESMESRISSKEKFYARKRKMESEKKFVKTYNFTFSVISIINKLIPNLIQGAIVKNYEKDKEILELYK